MKKHKQVKCYHHYLIGQQIPKAPHLTKPEIVRALNHDIADEIRPLIFLIWGSLADYEKT